MNKLISLALIFIFICGSFTTVFSPVLASLEPVGGSWNSKSPMSQARGGLGVVAVDGKIYAIGGKTVEGFVGSNERYDPKADTWTVLESMPTARAYFAIAAYQGKIYCVGGLNANGVSSVTEVYDTDSDSWSFKTSLPVKGKNLQGAVVDGKIFVIESYNLFMYDPQVDLWTKKSNLPADSLVGSDSIASAVVDNTIIVTSKLNIIIYDYNTDTWSKGTKPPCEFSQGISGTTTGVCAPKRIYTIGTITTKEEWWEYGREDQISPGYVNSMVPIMMIYDPANHTWSNVNIVMNRVDFGVAVIDDILYVIGGYMVLLGETSVTVDVKEFVAGVTYWGEYRTVHKQLVAQESVVGNPCSWNWQYVPVGYKVTTTDDGTSSPNQRPDESTWFKLSLTVIIIAGLALIVGIATIGLFLHFKKRSLLKNVTYTYKP